MPPLTSGRATSPQPAPTTPLMETVPSTRRKELETFEFEGEEEFSNQFDAISFGPAPRRQSRPQVAPRHGEVDLDEMVFRSLFWCATEVDPSGYVMEWGQCNAGCK